MDTFFMETEFITQHLDALSKKIGYSVAVLHDQDFPQVMTLSNHVLQFLNSPDFYHTPHDEAIVHLCLRQGLALGVFAAKELIAYQLAYYPGSREDNLGRDIGLRSEQLGRVAQFSGIAVNTAYRNKGVGLALAECALQLVKELGLSYVLATCHPENMPSLRMLVRLEFRIRNLKEKYGGKLRYILCKEIDNNQLSQPLVKEVIDHTDIRTQQRILEQGYIGVGIQDHPGGYKVLFVKL